MAKLTARGARPMAKATSELVLGSGVRYRFLWALRSDAKVLRRATVDAGTNYTILGTVRPGSMPVTDAEAADFLHRLIKQRGHEVVS